jgi:predicted secreted hydrolase
LKQLAGLILGCLFAVVLQAQELEALRDRGIGFAQVTPGKTLLFPQDHGSHPDYRIEWWYLTANLSDRDGRNWGLQWTLFRQGLSPARAETGWSSSQVWMAHAAITTPDGHFYEQRFARDGIGQAGVKGISDNSPFNAWIDDWEWHSNGPEMFPAKLSFSIGERDVILLLEATGELVQNGINGYSQKSEQGQASYYYSQPHIRVRGFVNQGTDKTYLSGQGWLDREWSSQSLTDNQMGWDWFSLHLNDGHKLMVYQLRNENGKHWLSGNWISPQGISRPLGRDAIDLSFVDIRNVATGDDKSRKLPMEWQLALVEQNRSWRIKPLYDEQWMDTRVPYWEGVVLVEDETGKPSGIGYMELTGYE